MSQCDRILPRSSWLVIFISLLIIVTIVIVPTNKAQHTLGLGIAANSTFGGPAISVRYRNAQFLVGYDYTNPVDPYFDTIHFGIALRYNQPILQWKGLNLKVFAQVDPGRLLTFRPPVIRNSLTVSYKKREFEWDETDWRYSGGGSVDIRIAGESFTNSLFLNLEIGFASKKGERKYPLSPNTVEIRYERFWQAAAGFGLHYFF